MSNSAEDIFDFQEYLQSDGLSQWRDVQNVESIIRSVSASISVIGSAATIWHILRSHKGLSSTYHRLVFGLCVGDLMVSLAWAIFISAPKEVQYVIPSARGNLGTCAAQGIFLILGIMMASLYNCSICFYYLAIITFNKKDEYITRKLEPWFHGVLIILAIVIVIAGLILKQFNSDGVVNTCYLTSYNPPHCWGVKNGIIPEGFTIPCGRGDTKSGNLFRLIIHLLPVTISPAIIIGTMATMYRTVRNIEQKIQKYGSTSLRLSSIATLRASVRTSQQQAQIVDGQFLATLKSKVMSICPCVRQNDNVSRSNNARSQKRAVLYMAMGYSLTWVLTWIPFYILFFVRKNKVTRTLHAVLYPLQGLYNLIVYMSPKVRHARSTRRGKLSWREATVKAWMSKGEEDRAFFGRRNAITPSMWQRLQCSLNRFMDRRRRSSAGLTSSKTSISGGAMIQPPSSVKQNRPKDIDRTADNERKKDREAYEGVNTIAPPSIYQNERKKHKTGNHNSKNKVHTGTKAKTKRKSIGKHSNYARNDSLSALHNNVDLIDLSRDELTHCAVIKSKQSQSIESEGSIIEKIDNDPRGNGNSTRIDDAWKNSNLLSYQSSRKPSSALDDDNLSEDEFSC